MKQQSHKPNEKELVMNKDNLVKQMSAPTAASSKEGDQKGQTHKVKSDKYMVL